MSDYLTTSQPGELSYSHWSQVKAISWSGHSLSRLSQCVQSTAGCEGSMESCTVCLLAHPRLSRVSSLTSDNVMHEAHLWSPLYQRSALISSLHK